MDVETFIGLISLVLTSVSIGVLIGSVIKK